MPNEPLDLLIRTGRALAPGSPASGPVAVAVRGDRIAAVGLLPSVSARHTWEFPNGILLPGLIDLHAHPACEGSIFGVDPDLEFLPQGVTTVLSQGDAGASNWPHYRRTTIASSRIRVRLAINLSALGEAAHGCFKDLKAIDVEACVQAIEGDAGRFIWGIAVNASHHACGATDPREVLRRARIAAERTGRPLLYGMRRPADWPLAAQMEQLRPGDVVTYCFRREPHCIIEASRVHPAIHAARARGIIFDVGHGTASFDFPTAEAALADGFPPDTISTDWQACHRGLQPPHSLPRVMAKLLAAGMSAPEVLAAVTATPARILRLDDEIGCLRPGACADLVVLAWNDRAAPLEDTHGNRRRGGCWETLLTVRAGHVLHPPESGIAPDRPCQS
jgi:dihydroorotase